MKKLFTAASLAFATLGLLQTPAEAQVVNYNPGDLIVGFTANAGQGSGSVVLVSLGAATAFRDAGNNNSLNLTNIGADLTATFGSGWASRTDLFWGAAGVFDSAASGPITNGDPVRTVYTSLARPDASTQSAAFSGLSSSTRGTGANRINTVAQGFDTANASVNNPFAAVMTISVATWDKYQPSSIGGNISFGAYQNTGLGIQQSFAAGSWGVLGGDTLEGALDIYRIVDRAGGTPSGTIGTGIFTGNIGISSTGQINFYAVPEPSTYALLALGAAFIIFGFARNRKANLR